MKKKLLIIFGIFLLTGCSAEYHIEINNRQVIVEGKLLESNTSKWDQTIIENEDEEIDHNQDPNYCMDNTCEIEDGEMNSSSLTYRELIDLKTINEETKIEGLKKIEDIHGLGISTKKEFTLSSKNSLKEIPGLNTCYDHISIVENENQDGMILSTSTKNLCFEIYDILEEITIHLKTNHEVKNHNADEVVNGEYTWKINKNNYDNKSIQINLLNKTHEKRDLSLLILLGGAILIIVAIAGMIGINIWMKSNRVNTIR